MSPPNVPDSHDDHRAVTLQGEFSKKLVTNTLFNLLGRSWSFVLALLLTPYILAHLDVREFGTWVVLSIFISSNASFNLFDFGLGSSFVKYIAEFYTHGDFGRINRVLFSGLVFYSAFGVFLVGMGLLIQNSLFEIFHLTGASTAYLLVLISWAVSNVAVMFLSVFRGIQRMDTSNSLEIKISIANAIGTILFLQAGWGLLGLAMNALVNASFAVLLSWWTLRRRMPVITLGWHFDGKLLRSMFAYGIKMQISQLGGFICFRLDKLIVSKYLGIAPVSFYEVSSRLTSFMRALPHVMISALIPATSELGARNDRARILQTYLLASKYVAMLTVAMVAFLVLEARAVITLWLGTGFESSVILVQILAIGYGANVLGGAASQTGAGVGRPEFDMRSTVLLSLLNPIFSISLVQWFGAPGAAAGTSIAFVIATVYLLVVFHRNYVMTSVRGILQDVYLRPIAAGIFASLAVLGFHRLAPQLLNLESVRYLVPVKMAADFGIFAPLYIVLLVTFRQVTAIDWNNFVGLMSFSSEFLRHPLRERVKIYR
jgi:O-antigen/teichoic acid export membrane protein